MPTLRTLKMSVSVVPPPSMHHLSGFPRRNLYATETSMLAVLPSREPSIPPITRLNNGHSSVKLVLLDEKFQNIDKLLVIRPRVQKTVAGV